MTVRKIIEITVAQTGESHPTLDEAGVLGKCVSRWDRVRSALGADSEEEVLTSRGSLTSGIFTFGVFGFAT